MQTNFSSFNVRGLRNQQKREQIFQWLKTNKSSISMLQETHTNNECEAKWEREWGGKAYFSGNKGNKEGVCILLNENENFQVIKHTEIIVGRMQCLELKINEKCLMIVNVYGPNNDDVDFFEKLEAFVRDNEDQNIIIGGDFNTVMDPKIDKRNGNIDTHKKCRSQLNSFLNTCNFSDIWRLLNSDKKQYINQLVRDFFAIPAILISPKKVTIMIITNIYSSTIRYSEIKEKPEISINVKQYFNIIFAANIV